MSVRRLLTLVIALASAGVLVVVPLSSSPYVNQQIALVAIYAVALMGLSIVTGHSGQVSLAQAAFFGMGAYTAALCARAGWPPVAALAMAALLPGILGAVLAIPLVRLRGHALAMMTIAVSLAAVPLVKRFDAFTGGSQGLTVPMGDAPEWTGLARDQWAYYVAVVVAAVMFLIAHNMLKGKTGYAMSMIRTNEIVATAMGIPVNRYKIQAFAISAVYGGVAGFLFAYCVRFVSPETLNFLFGIMMIASLVVGGLRSLAGPVLGAGFYVYVPALAGGFSAEGAYVINGAVLLLVVLFLPEGVASIPARILTIWRRRASTPFRPVSENSPAQGAVITHAPEEREKSQ